MKFFVIGSCYSGYMFKEKLLGKRTDPNFQMVYQHQHDSLIGLMSDPVEVDLQGVKSKYQWDFDHFAQSLFEKDIIQKIKEMQPDYLVFDSYAEAVCPVLKISETAYVTGNYYIQGSDVMNQLQAERRIPPESVNERFALFQKYYDLFLKALREVCPGLKLILVRAHAAPELADAAAVSTELFSYKAKIEAMNRLRDRYDAYILEHTEKIYAGGIRCLDMTDICLPADTVIRDHFGYEISHNHYCLDYYRLEYQKLHNIVIGDLTGGQTGMLRYFRQAVIIRAGRDFDMLYILARLYKDFFYVYIHISRTDIGTVFTPEQIAKLRAVPNVFVTAKEAAPYGSFTEMCGILDLTEAAFRNPELTYVHYVEDTDLPIRSAFRLYNHFARRDNITCLNLHFGGSQEYMEEIAPTTWRYYNYFYDADPLDPVVWNMMTDAFEKQRKNGIQRKGIGEFTRLYKGVYGGSVTREAYEYCRDYIREHPRYLDDIKFTRLGPEFLFHTILFNAKELEGRVKGADRGAGMEWAWDTDRKDYLTVTPHLYQEWKKNENVWFVRGTGSKNRELTEQILQDIGSPYGFD